MKITRIETLTVPAGGVTAVEVYTDEGLVGLGQTGWDTSNITPEVLHQLVAPVFLGQSPWDLQYLVDRCLRTNYKFTGTFLFRALCGVETALWDLLGKATSHPVYQLLGGAFRSEVPVYASSMRRDSTPEQEAERMRQLVEQHGFRCVKIKIGNRMARDTDALPGRTERIIPLMREALGPDVDISADANGGFSVPRAIKIGRLLEAHDYFHFEEPCPFEELENTAKVAAVLDIPIAGGEQDNSLPQFRRMINLPAVDIVQCDIGYVGGLSRACKVAEMAERAGLPCTPHSSNSTLLQIFTLHLVTAMPACYHYQEWRADPPAWTREMYSPHIEVDNGVVRAPRIPGWGVELLEGYRINAEIRVSRAE
jgi:L-alanine-DL-glutamate epimerase-like enolase superfamily enzyme